MKSKVLKRMEAEARQREADERGYDAWKAVVVARVGDAAWRRSRERFRHAYKLLDEEG